jgi:ribosomal-protein-alanine N-acetyltransferase
MKSIVNFESERLTFRGFCDHDLDDLFEVLGNEKVCEFLPVNGSYSKEQVKRVLNRFIQSFHPNSTDLHYIVIHTISKEVIGYCGCSFIQEYDCNEIEYFLKPQYFHRGFATEMALKMKEVAIHMGLKTLVGLADTRNRASQVILEKIGYVYQREVDHWGLRLKLFYLNLESINN